jgi:membrane peptidoglycan carboxypeptidase
VIIYNKIMSEVAYFRFKSNNMLTKDEKEHEDKIIQLTEEVLQAKGIECYSRISRRSQEQLKEIVEEVRQLLRKKKKNRDLEIAIQ